MLRERIFRPKHSFYDIIAGALLGGAAEITAQVCQEAGNICEEAGTIKGLLIILLRFAGVSAICLAGGFLIRIARALENIERAYEVERPQLIDVLRSESGSEQAVLDEQQISEILHTLRNHRRELEEDKGKQVVPSFRWALALAVLALILFFISGLPFDQLLERILELFQVILHILQWIIRAAHKFIL